jgi:ribosomal protein S18 acetylase RimI-like enzyme
MTSEMQFTQDRATHEDIARHLRLCDTDFVPTLSARVQIPEYAEKLVSHAARFEAWQHGILVGLIAAYCNDRENRGAYITSVSVLADLRHHGVGACLLRRCLKYLNDREFTYVELQVDSRNHKAVRLYERFGFQAVRADGQATIMSLKMGKEGINGQPTGL